jgi:hypothetical protein
VALPFTLKKYLKAKRRIMETSNISPCKNIPNLQKINPLKETKIFQDIIYNFVTNNLKFQQKQKYHLFKNPHTYKNRPIIIT